MAKPADDTAFDKENKKNSIMHAESDAAFGFPSEFPYEFDSFGAETESSDEEEDFFAGLTRRLSQASIHETRKQLTVPKSEIQEKTRVMSGSPQSILSGIGSWSGRSGGSSDVSPNGSTRVPSPTTTPFRGGNDAWDVLYAAAGEVARLKLNNEASKFDFHNNRGLLGGGGGGLPQPIAAENRAAPPFANQNLPQFQYQQVKQQCGSVWGRPPAQAVQNRGRDLGYEYETVKCTRPLPRSAWQPPPLQAKQQNNPFPFGGSGSRPVGSGVKRGCGGTGVFLPRQYGVPPPESRKKTSGAPVLVPAKVIHALNLNIEELNAARSQPRFPNDFAVDYDALLARRNALLMQQQQQQQQRLSMLREEAASYEVRLPQEWTY